MTYPILFFILFFVADFRIGNFSINWVCFELCFVEFCITQSVQNSNLQSQAWRFQGYLSRRSPSTSFEGEVYASFFTCFLVFKFGRLAKIVVI